MTPISSDLQGLLAQAGDRIAFQYANANRLYGFTYPLGLVGDTTPPLISGLAVNSIGTGVVMISWTTNEFAATTLRYGVQPGIYTQTITDTLYYKLHEFTVSGLTIGARYYYRIVNTDRSGNGFQSQEYNFTVPSFVYLPLIRR